MPMWGTQQDTRPPPPDGAPPAYTTVIRRVYKGSMRGVLIFTAFLGMLWALVMGVEEIKDMSQSNETAKMKVFALVIAILYFVVAGVEAALIVIAIMRKPNFGQLIRIIGPLGFALVVGANVLTMARHFSLKTDLIYQCVQRTTGQGGWSSSGGSFTFSQDQAQTACENAWNKRTWTVVGWFLVSIILAGIFLSIALSYRRELLDPSSRQTTQRFEAYPMQTHPSSNPYGNLPPPPGGAYNNINESHGQGQGQGWQVPPYPGPPPGGAPNAYEKGDYHPQADWANAGVGADSTVGGGNGNRTGFGYDIPPGSPPRGGAGAGEAGRPYLGDRSATQAQDEAWLEAQRTGPTAHLTSPTSPRRNDNASGGAGGSGRVIANEEEDEAWARARREGVTAHLTGGGAGGKSGGGVV